MFLKNEIKIAVMDNNDKMQDGLVRFLIKEGFTVDSVINPEIFINTLAPSKFHIIILDIVLSDTDGLEIIRAAKRIDPSVVCIVITAYATVENTVEAIKSGAFDVLEKPFNTDSFRILLHKSVKQVVQNYELMHLMGKTKKDFFYGMIGSSPAMQNIFVLLERIAPRDVIILINGASGTGKELTARAIHSLSHRSKGNFVAVNCGALPESLIDAELFGYKKGAFTGAVSSREGLIRSAEGGTLFLDEIGDLPFPTQLRLLRFLQEGEVRPVGSDETYKVDVRVIAASYHDLKALVIEGKFREDLFYRLSVVPIYLPKLSERSEDIPYLTMHFLEKSAKKHGMSVPRMTGEALDALVNYEWPGNVRQLENIIERIILLDSDGVIELHEIPSTIRESINTPFVCADSIPDDYSLEEIERWYIKKVLEKNGNNRSRAADILKISRRTLQRKLRDWGDESSDE